MMKKDQISEAQYTLLVESLPHKIFFKDKNSVYIFCNKNYARDLKIEAEKIKGKTDYDFFPKELAKKYRTDDKIIMESGKTENIEEKYIQNGEERFVHTVKTPVRDEQGNVIGVLGIFWDITHHKQAEEALQESERLYRSLFENMLNGFAYCKMIFEQDRPQDFVYLSVNSAFEALTGLKNIVGKKVSEVIPGIQKSNPELFEIYGRVALTGKHEKFEAYLPGLKMWFLISVYSPEKGYFVAVFDVITESKQEEEKEQKRLAELETFYKASIGREGRIIELKKEIEILKKELNEKK